MGGLKTCFLHSLLCCHFDFCGNTHLSSYLSKQLNYDDRIDPTIPHTPNHFIHSFVHLFSIHSYIFFFLASLINITSTETMISRFVRSLRVVAFNSSPRVGSNCGVLVDRMLGVLQKKGIETEHVQFGRELLAGCQACDPPKCKDGECFQMDDPINEYASKMREADGIILASPTYYAGINSNMKALIDRCGFQLMASSHPGHNPLRRKVGVGIGVHRRGGATTAIAQLNYFFMISGVTIV
jgi:multimeric flavodoxin WrbA